MKLRDADMLPGDSLTVDADMKRGEMRCDHATIKLAGQPRKEGKMKETERTILLALAKPNEERKRHFIGFERQTEDERRFVAELKAEGSIEEKAGDIRFTDKGYNKYRARITAERAFPTPQ